MKKTLLILFFLFTAFNGFSQERDEKLKALKVAYITERLDLTEAEAQKFWPIYNTFEDKQRELRKQQFLMRKNSDFESLSEDEAIKKLDEAIVNENKLHELRQKFIEDVRKVLPPKKVILLMTAEETFKRQMLEQFKKRRMGRP